MNDNNKPTFIHRDHVLNDDNYVQWLVDVKKRFRKNQIKAAVQVNTGMLEFYWSIGRDLVTMKAEQRWGSGIVKQFSLDMRKAFPDEKGFSHTNIKYMKRWYLFYYERVTKGQQVADLLETEKSQQLADQIETEKSQQVVDLLEAVEIRQQVADELEMPEAFGFVPWFHHIAIITKCETLNEAIFYINKTVDEHWSRSTLEHKIKSRLYQTQGKAITNFSTRLPAPDSKLAQELLKSEYNLEFLGISGEVSEMELESKIAANITQFLLELGKGFAYVGRQMELQMPGGQTFFPDLVFYHIPQKRYLVIELKAVQFAPEFAGKINFYVNAADELLKGEDDNPSIGLIICRSYDKTTVEWSLRGVETPLGVAAYQLQEVVDRTIKELEMSRRKGK